jgi:hypothetical protein
MVLGLAIAAMVVGCSPGVGDQRATTSTAVPTGAKLSAMPTEPLPVTPAAWASTLLDSADFPQGLKVRQEQAKVLVANDVPGLGGTAEAYFLTLASDDGNEFVNGIAVVPESATAATALLDQFTSANYAAGLTGGAADATVTLRSGPDEPAGSKRLDYSGTVPIAGQEQRVTGTAVAFVHGRTFVVIIHGTYGASDNAIDPGRVAAAVDTRLAGLPEAN